MSTIFPHIMENKLIARTSYYRYNHNGQFIKPKNIHNLVSNSQVNSKAIWNLLICYIRKFAVTILVK